MRVTRLAGELLTRKRPTPDLRLPSEPRGCIRSLDEATMKRQEIIARDVEKPRKATP